MAQSLILILKASVFEKEKSLIINREFFSFGTTSFSKTEITDIRYGVKSIYGLRFRIGRVYCIDIKSYTGNVIKIRLKSIYRVRKNKLEKKYLLILNALLENYIHPISQSFVNKFSKGINFNILDVEFKQKGILLSKNAELIYWNDLGSRDYWHYYSLYSISTPGVYKTFDYLADWNTVVLYSVSRHILKVKKLLPE